MEKYTFTNEDYQNIEQLFIITKKIKDLYSNLIDLEVRNRKYTDDYNTILNQLNIVLMRENELYHLIGDNPAKLTEILFRMFNYEQPNTVDILNYARDNSEKELIKARIGIRLEKIVTDDKFPVDEEFEEEMNALDYEAIDTLSDYDSEDDYTPLMKMEDVEKQFEYMSALEDLAEIDILNTILKILSEYIFNPEYQNIIALLIRFKYMLSFTFKNIEKDFLSNNFEINQDLYWSAKMVVDIHNGNINDLKNSNESFSEDIIYEQSDNLTRLIFEDLQKKSNYGSAIISQTIIRAGLLFSNNVTIQNFRKFITGELIDSKVDNKIMEDIINKAINSVDYDKTLPKIISFKL